MRDGQAGLGHPPWRGGGGGVRPEVGVSARGKRGFLKGSERPEAGQPRRIGEFKFLNSNPDYVGECQRFY